jgi:hypothetical protein
MKQSSVRQETNIILEESQKIVRISSSVFNNHIRLTGAEDFAFACVMSIV